MADDADEVRPARGLGDPRELGAMRQQPAQRSRLLADLREERAPGAGGSGGDTRFAANEDTLDLQFFGKDEQVCGCADLDPARVGADHARRDGGGRPSAASSGTPSACRFRTASIIVRTLPARTPSPSRRTTPSRTSTETSPRR